MLSTKASRICSILKWKSFATNTKLFNATNNSNSMKKSMRHSSDLRSFPVGNNKKTSASGLLLACLKISKAAEGVASANLLTRLKSLRASSNAWHARTLNPGCRSSHVVCNKPPMPCAEPPPLTMIVRSLKASEPSTTFVKPRAIFKTNAANAYSEILTTCKLA